MKKGTRHTAQTIAEYLIEGWEFWKDCEEDSSCDEQTDELDALHDSHPIEAAENGRFTIVMASGQTFQIQVSEVNS